MAGSARHRINLASDKTVHNQLVFYPDGKVSLVSVLRQELKDKHVEQNFLKSVNMLSTFSSQKKVAHTIVEVGEVYAWSVAYRIPKERPMLLRESRTATTLASDTAQGEAIYVPPEIVQAVTDNLQEQGRQAELAAEQSNRADKIRAAAIYNVLRRTTNQSLEDNSAAWWNWWSDYNERYRPGLKPVQKLYATSTVKLALDSRSYDRTLSTVTYKPVPKTLVQFSCLVAGTTVQTSTGPRAIESIEIGDLVAAQDEDSGEIALRPVLLTTIRPPKAT